MSYVSRDIRTRQRYCIVYTTFRRHCHSPFWMSGCMYACFLSCVNSEALARRRRRRLPMQLIYRRTMGRTSILWLAVLTAPGRAVRATEWPQWSVVSARLERPLAVAVRQSSEDSAADRYNDVRRCSDCGGSQRPGWGRLQLWVLTLISIIIIIIINKLKGQSSRSLVKLLLQSTCLSRRAAVAWT